MNWCDSRSLYRCHSSNGSINTKSDRWVTANVLCFVSEVTATFSHAPTVTASIHILHSRLRHMAQHCSTVGNHSTSTQTMLSESLYCQTHIHTQLHWLHSSNTTFLIMAFSTAIKVTTLSHRIRSLLYMCTAWAPHSCWPNSLFSGHCIKNRRQPTTAIL